MRSVNPFVSVIIPTYNREDCLIDLLEVLVEQDYSKYEIIVIDQTKHISGKKIEFIQSHANLINYFKIDRAGRSLAKNVGIINAKGDILLFCDDDIIPPNNFISTHARNYINKDVGAVSCRIVEEGQPDNYNGNALKATLYGRMINRAFSLRSGYVNSLNGGNMSIKKEAILRSGYFEEYFEGTSMVEEPDYAYRLIRHGYNIYFDSNITIKHFPQISGNKSFMESKRTEWFYYYFYNLLIYYIKYGRFINLPFVLVYCIALSIKHIVKYRLSPLKMIGMIRGYKDGMKKGIKIYFKDKENKYFTNIRFVHVSSIQIK